METLNNNNSVLEKVNDNTFKGPGLVDLQVNGAAGVDFNDVENLTEEDILYATQYLFKRGVTTYFPTFVTNSDDNITGQIKKLAEACEKYPLVKKLVGGIHVEGPFISPEDGARGAHNLKYVKAPDWDLMKRFQDVAQGMIKIVTIAPEWDEAAAFIERCRENNILVSMGHSLANTDQINRAISAGITLSTHLGNGIPLMIKRHPNLLWDQLASEDLISMIIADGHHIPDAFIKVVMKVKGEKIILVSDMTKFAGMPAGEYVSPAIGGMVVLDSNKRLSVKGGGGILAGAAKDITECVETLINHRLASLDDAWRMASSRVINLLAPSFPGFHNTKSEVRFSLVNGKIKILKAVSGEFETSGD